MSTKIKITEEEYKKVQELYQKAAETPLMLMNGVDINSEAWRNVRKYMDMLGKKYNYDPAKNTINRNGEVIPFENDGDYN